MKTHRLSVIACAAATLFLMPQPSRAQIVDMPGIVGVKVFEGTGFNANDYIHEWDFLLNPFMDSRLFVKQAEPFTLRFTDIATDAGEFYDVYLSNARGQFDVNGNYIAIHYMTKFFHTGFAVGGNIDAIGLVFSDGSVKWASSLARVRTGQGLGSTQDILNGFAENALGPQDGQVTYLGDGEGLLVVGF